MPAVPKTRFQTTFPVGSKLATNASLLPVATTGPEPKSTVSAADPTTIVLAVRPVPASPSQITWATLPPAVLAPESATPDGMSVPVLPITAEKHERPRASKVAMRALPDVTVDVPTTATAPSAPAAIAVEVAAIPPCAQRNWPVHSVIPSQFSSEGAAPQSWVVGRTSSAQTAPASTHDVLPPLHRPTPSVPSRPA